MHRPTSLSATTALVLITLCTAAGAQQQNSSTPEKPQPNTSTSEKMNPPASPNTAVKQPAGVSSPTAQENKTQGMTGAQTGCKSASAEMTNGAVENCKK